MQYAGCRIAIEKLKLPTKNIEIRTHSCYTIIVLLYGPRTLFAKYGDVNAMKLGIEGGPIFI